MYFKGKEHRGFFMECMERSKVDDSYHRAFFYTVGICNDTRKHVNDIFDFSDDSIKLDALEKGWQTSGSSKVCLLAFNLWNGFVASNDEQSSTPYELFNCEFAPYFYEALKLKYPQSCYSLETQETKKAKSSKEQVR